MYEHLNREFVVVFSLCNLCECSRDRKILCGKNRYIFAVIKSKINVTSFSLNPVGGAASTLGGQSGTHGDLEQSILTDFLSTRKSEQYFRSF